MITGADRKSVCSCDYATGEFVQSRTQAKRKVKKYIFKAPLGLDFNKSAESHQEAYQRLAV